MYVSAASSAYPLPRAPVFTTSNADIVFVIADHQQPSCRNGQFSCPDFPIKVSRGAY